MKARFIGDPNDGFSGPAEITCWGVDFVKGEWVTVEDARFGAHSHFEFENESAAFDLHKLKVPQLKEMAERMSIELGDATKKDDIIAAIELAQEAAEQEAEEA